MSAFYFEAATFPTESKAIAKRREMRVFLLKQFLGKGYGLGVFAGEMEGIGSFVLVVAEKAVPTSKEQEEIKKILGGQPATLSIADVVRIMSLV